MWLKPDPKAATSVSAQIREDVLTAIRLERIGEGEKLPSVRGLAAEILVNPNTVAKVYRELERDGILETHPGSGVLVAMGAVGRARSELDQNIRGAAIELIQQAARAGVSGLELLAILESSLPASAASPETRSST